jgi:uncharacterized membrane protein YdjX (TVP38/TMEM64 family)
MQQPFGGAMRKASWIRLSAIVVVIGALSVLPFLLPIQGPIRDFLDWVRGLGAWGLVALALFWIPAAILLVPGTVITLAGGALFGVVEATIAISLGSTVGACAAFLVGRGLARPWVERQIAGNARFQAVDHAIAAQGFKIVLLLRLSPVFPYNLLNYILALTRVSFRDYFLATWIGMVPGTIMYVYIGSTVGELAALFTRRDRTQAELVFFFTGLAVTVVVTIYITRLAKRALDRAIAEAGERSAPASAGDGHV